MQSRRDLLKDSALLAASTVFWCPSLYSQELTAPVAATNSGSVRGFINEGVFVFKGIPYGDDTALHRFQPPTRPVPWVGVRDAVAFGPQAPQATPSQVPRAGRGMFSPLDEISPVNSEDCLHLNVWTPGLRDNGRRPVMVYLHGGGYSNSSSNGPVYDGVRLVKRGDVVVVTLNHRLNLFGYLYLAQIGGSTFADSGNVGQLDLILALEWVRDNIGEFGGDPRNVMIFGQSGGGAKCATLMAMPRARSLFHRVATMSGQQLTATTPEHATATAQTVLAALGVNQKSLGDLRDPLKFPMEKLVAASRVGTYYGPVHDGRALPRDPFSPEAPLLSSRIPMMLGSTHDETRILVGSGNSSLFALSWAEVPSRLEEFRPFLGTLKTETIVALYRQWYPAYSPTDVFFSATTAFRSWHGLVLESERRAAQPGLKGPGPTWVYEFDWKSPVDGGKWGATHGLDIPFAFDTVQSARSMTGSSPEAQALASQMSDTFIAFARNGDPNNSAIPKWPRFDLTSRATLCWDTQSETKNDPRGDERRLLSQVPYVQPGT